MNDFPGCDGEGIRPDRLDPLLVRPRLDGLFDVRVDAEFKLRK